MQENNPASPQTPQSVTPTPTVPVPVIAATPVTVPAASPNIEASGGSKMGLKMPLIIGGIVLLLLVAGGVGGYFLVVSPRVEATKFSQNLLSQVPKLQTNLGEVNDAINQITSSLNIDTQQSAPPKQTTLRLDVSKLAKEIGTINDKLKQGQVAGAATSQSPIYSTSPIYTELAKNLKSGGSNQVLGKTTPASHDGGDIESLLREVKEGALILSQRSSSAQATLSSMSANKPNSSSASFTSLDQKLTTTNTSAKTFIDEAQKTGNYYSKISDVSLKLYPQETNFGELIRSIASSSDPASLVYKIEEFEKSFGNLESELNSIGTADMPEGITEVHANNKKIVTLLKETATSMKTSVTNLDSVLFVSAVEKFAYDLADLEVISSTTERSFWQNNTQLRQYNSLDQSYKDVISLARTVEEENKVPLLNK